MPTRRRTFPGLGAAGAAGLGAGHVRCRARPRRSHEPDPLLASGIAKEGRLPTAGTGRAVRHREADAQGAGTAWEAVPE